MAKPPISLNTLNIVKLLHKPVPKEVQIKRAAAKIKIGLRPKRSLNFPAIKAPTAYQGTAHCPPLHIRIIGNLEKLFIKRFSPSDNNPIISEQKSSHCGSQGYKKQKKFTVCIHRFSVLNFNNTKRTLFFYLQHREKCYLHG